MGLEFESRGRLTLFGGRDGIAAVNDISHWLADLGLEQYAEAFADNAIDDGLLADLSDADLKEIGIKTLGHRKKILAAIAQRCPAHAVKDRAITEKNLKPIESAERRNLTVMFVDLVGSTSLSRKLDPEEMREVLRDYQNAVAGEITRLEGHVAKFMGDGVLAYFGWPRAHEDEAERAVRAGLAITAAVGRLNGGGVPLSCRIGIATGMVIVGDLVGEGAAQEEAVVGETPNLASRLQVLAKPGSVVIAESTRRLVGDLFEYNDLGPQELKGIEAATLAFAVFRERTLESRFAARAGTAMQPIVGREQELALLIERWRQAEAGEGQMVLLTGEAGIGKSRIAEALIAALKTTPHVNLRYQCSPYHTDSALWPVSQQVLLAARIQPDDPAETRLDKLESVLLPAGAVPRQTAALFATLLGFDSEVRYGSLDLTPSQRRNRTLDALITQLVGLAAQQPVLFVLEDAHWIDPTTLELVELALDRVGQAQVLMVLTARPTFVHGFGGHPIVTRLTLNRLGRAQTTAIIERITGGKALPESLVDEIAARTDGVPLYVEEMTKAVLESGFLREAGDAWKLDTPLAQLAIPTSLHDSLMARLDRLKPVKEVAQTAAVIGRAFDHRTIAALSGLPEAELIVAMNRLVDAELVFRRGTAPEATYLFKHALVRDAAYESLLKSRRQVLHARLFDILERQGAVPPEILAQHAEAAGMTDEALDFWEVAASQAIARPAYKEAIAHCEAAIRLCQLIGDERLQQRREGQLQLQLGQALLASLGYQAPEAMAAFDRARKLAEAVGEFSVLMPAIWGSWANRYISGVDMADLATRLGELTAARDDRGSRCVALRMLALERFHAAQYESSLDLVHQALAIYDPVLHRDFALRYGHDPRSAATSYKAWNLWHLGYPDQARKIAEESFSWAKEIGHQNTIGIALCFGPTLTSIWLRDVDRVMSATSESLRLATQMSLALWKAWGRIHAGWALAESARPGGLAELEAGLEEVRQMGAGRLESFHLGLAADVQSKAGQHEAAKAKIAAAFAAQEKNADMPFVADLYRLRALAALRASVGNMDAVVADLRRAIKIAQQQRARSLELRATRDLARLWAERGERQRAFDLLSPIYAWFSEGFDTPDLKESKTLLGQLV